MFCLLLSLLSEVRVKNLYEVIKVRVKKGLSWIRLKVKVGVRVKGFKMFCVF